MELRKYQTDAIEKIRDSIRKNNRNVILQAACGAGKTIIAAEIVRLAIEKERNVIFLQNRRDLVHQTFQKFQDYGIGEHCAVIMAGEEYELEKPVQIVSIQTYARRLKLGGDWVRPADLIIFDECHSSVAPTYKKIVDEYRDKAMILGLTATPCRSDGRGLGTIYDDIVECIGIQDLIEMKYLVPMIHYGPASPDLEKIKITAGDYNKKELGHAMDKPELIGDIYDNWMEIADNRQTVIFAVNVKHSKHIRDLFNRRGVTCEHIDAHTNDEERNGIYNRFKNGDTRILTNVGICTEGSDFPFVGTIVIARPTKSYGRFIQMAGRGLRPDNGKSDCVSVGTKILTDKGSIEIENITLDHKVWDGVSFVNHGGAICKGIQKTITYQGLTATLNHEVMTNEGWRSFKETVDRQLKIVKTGSCGNPIRFTQDNFKKNRTWELPTTCGSIVRKLWSRIYDTVSQYKEKTENSGLPIMQPAHANGCAGMGLSKGASPEKQMRKQKQLQIFGLWWPWNRVQVRYGSPCNGMDKKQSWNTELKKSANRQDKQRRSLRTRKSEMDITSCKHEQFKDNKRRTPTKIYKFQKCISIYQVCRQYATSIYFNRGKRRRNYIQVGKAIKQTEREVWDIHNAGPLQRFTANGLLVHNCILLDHAGNIDRHGFVEDEMVWTLSDKEKAAKKPPKKKEKLPLTCDMCTHVFTGKKCPQCGHEIPDYGKKIEALEAKLEQLGKPKKAKATTEDKRIFYGNLEWYRRLKGYKEGWVNHKFKAKFDVWPNHYRDQGPIVPNGDGKFMNWIKYQNIKWSKSKKKAEKADDKKDTSNKHPLFDSWGGNVGG